MEVIVRAAREQEVVEIDDTAVARLGAAITPEEFRERTQRVQWPLQFSSINDEVNLLAVSHVLGLRADLQLLAPRCGQETLGEVVLFGVLGMYLSGTSLGASSLATTTASDVASTFSIPMLEEVEDQSLPGVRIERRGPLASYADRLAQQLQAAGRRLGTLGHADFAGLVRAAFATGSAAGAAGFLASQLEGLHDAGPAEGVEGQLAFHKNALRLVADVHARCGPRDTGLSLPDVGELMAAPSVDTISALLQLGVLVPRGEAGPGAGGPEGLGATPARVAAVRAAAVAAVHALCAAAPQLGQECSPLDMSRYLEGLVDTSFDRFVPCEAEDW